jgi:glycosyltransferase involved in cell wall biosynthesis
MYCLLSLILVHSTRSGLVSKLRIKTLRSKSKVSQLSALCPPLILVPTFYILAPFDPIPGEPGCPARFETLKKAIEARGHRCIWWTSTWGHTSKAERAMPALESGIRLLTATKYHQNVSLARLRNHRALAESYKFEVHSAIRSGTLPPPDVQLVSMPPLETSKAAFAIQQVHGGRVVIDIMDTWPDTFFQVIPLPSRHLRAWVGKLLFMRYHSMLRSALEKCNAATAQSAGFLDWARERGLGDKAGHICYLGADLPEGANARSFQKGEALRLAYLGAMGTSYDLETLLRAVKRLIGEGYAIRLDLAGAGRKEMWIRRFVEHEGLTEQVFFHGYLPKTEAFALLDECHLGVVPLFPESGVTVPYKAGEYASRGLGIIYSLSGELDVLMRQAEGGLRYQAGNVDSMVYQIRSYFLDPELVAKHSRAALQLAQEHFDRSVSYPQMAQFLENVYYGDPK